MKIKISELTQEHTGSLVRYETEDGFVYYAFLGIVQDCIDEKYRNLSLVGGDYISVGVDREIDIVRPRKAPSRVGALIRIDDRTYRREEGENYPWLSDIGYSYRDGEIAKMIDDCYLYEVVSDEDK